MLPDVGPEAPVTCNPVMQTGCSTGEKCTWIIDQNGDATTADIAHIGCAADGSLAVGATCNRADATVNGGADMCVAGAFCVGGACEVICDYQNQTGCDSDHKCQNYADVFTSGDTTVAGLCDPTCDPLTQRLLTDQSEACGTPATAPTKECVSGDFTTFTCAPSGSGDYPFTDRVPVTGTVYLNSCAPGYEPLLAASETDTTTVCTGFCAPLDIDNGSNHVNNGPGDGTVAVKNYGDATPTVGHGKCTPDDGSGTGGKGSIDGGQEECWYIWHFNFAQDGTLNDSPYNDVLGYCFANHQYEYDSDMSGSDDTTFPYCNTLPPRGPTTTGGSDDSMDFGCVKSSEDTDLFENGHTKRVNPLRYSHGAHVPYGQAVLKRHAFH
jgi:hypothetical protein